MMFEVILTGLYTYLRYMAWRYPEFRARVSERNLIAQIRVREENVGRWYSFTGGRIRSRSGIHAKPDVVITYESAQLAAQLLTPPVDWLLQISAAKNYDLRVEGDEAEAYWFAQVLWAAQRTGWRFGTTVKDAAGEAVIRYTSMTNGGPCFVYVKDERILRITPIDFDETDAKSWTIAVRGRTLVPPHRATLAVHGLASKSLVYSPDRLLYPMKRVDFDPNGERSPSKRGISGYKRISWDEALDIVAGEIQRVKSVHGEGAMLVSHPSHHTWGNVGYYLSALARFANAVGHTRVHPNPDSWEGWYWGAQHHWGYSMRLGMPEPYGTVEDLLKEAELVVFWSSDPESTNGVYAAHEGTIRRQWLKDLGIPTVHIDPYYNATAAYMRGKWIAPRPGTDTAMALAIAWVWIKEGLYDRDFVEQRTHGFEKWKAYLLGEEDGVPKTPEWQEKETGVRAREVRALAREWGRKKTYLGAGGVGSGFGGACRGPTGHQWARAMACLAALQGLGRKGVNFGNLQFGTPVDLSFYFPGYAEGGISGDLMNSASAIALYQR
ncbi:MAG: molybdopterin-dependent oxidoreductase, partial [Candidatus Hydrogenedentes bacterium]|nr:molybdopterin-dependent oxidoreductase [Candidatus Hydrogenedentota bacterium]